VIAVVSTLTGFAMGTAVGWCVHSGDAAEGAGVAERGRIAAQRIEQWETEAEHRRNAPPPSSERRPAQTHGCGEDEPCFNPCTMGVNGHYPETDPQYRVPGPCDLFTPLPYGRRFAVAVTPEAAPPGVVCSPQGWGYMTVRVWVREADGRDVPHAEVSEAGCTDGKNAAVAEATHRLYPKAGALA
jgi:hypothetical protein